MAAMEGEIVCEKDSHEQEKPLTEKFSMRIHEYLYKTQQQNGLRHNDYTSYRAYCTKKLWSLRDSLSLKNGRSRFVKKELQETPFDLRYNLLLLTYAERAWAYAITLQAEFNSSNGEKPRVRIHAGRRFSKFLYYATQFEKQCEKTCDEATILEAQAYRLVAQGLLMEYKENWPKALEHLSSASKILETISRKHGREEEVAAFASRQDQIESSLRISEWFVRKTGGKFTSHDAHSSHAALYPLDGLNFEGETIQIPSEALASKYQSVISSILAHRLDISNLLTVISSHSSLSSLLPLYDNIDNNIFSLTDSIHQQVIQHTTQDDRTLVSSLTLCEKTSQVLSSYNQLEKTLLSILCLLQRINKLAEEKSLHEVVQSEASAVVAASTLSSAPHILRAQQLCDSTITTLYRIAQTSTSSSIAALEAPVTRSSALLRCGTPLDDDDMGLIADSQWSEVCVRAGLTNLMYEARSFFYGLTHLASLEAQEALRSFHFVIQKFNDARVNGAIALLKDYVSDKSTSKNLLGYLDRVTIMVLHLQATIQTLTLKFTKQLLNDSTPFTKPSVTRE